MPENESDIKINLDTVRQRITDAAQRSGRSADDITLIAVSKTKPWYSVARAIAHGQKDFGENTIQDALTKIPNTKDKLDINWHFIGPIQSNKTKHVPGNFQWLHTLESEKIARRLEGACAEINVPLNVLVQINIANDPAKKGIPANELDGFIDNFLQQNCKYLKLRGLMTIGAINADETTRRKWFSDLRTLKDKTSERFDIKNFDQLSMGMSRDFEEAIEEGSTIVRVGSCIFGART